MALWGKLDDANSKPKNLSTAQKTTVFFVDTTEAASTANRAKGIRTPGWVKVLSHTDAQGQERNKVEVLVAMSVTSGVAGDAADDVVVGDANLTITTQPISQTVAIATPLTFTVATDDGASYQWQVKAPGVAYVSVTDLGVYTGSTTDTLAISDADGLSGYKYRVVVLNTAGNTTVTSKPATLTVT